MNTRALFIAVFVVTVVIFGANYFATQGEAQEFGCKCNCRVKLVSAMSPSPVKDPSCSVVFVRLSGPKAGELVKLSLVRKGQEASAREDNCVFSVYCDSTHLAHVLCKDWCDPLLPSFACDEVDLQPIEVRGDTKCGFGCRPEGPGIYHASHNCDHWERPVPPPRQTPPPSKKTVRSGLLNSAILSMSLTSNNGYDAFTSGLLPASYTQARPDDHGGKDIVSRSTQWWPLGGEAGIEGGMLMVTTGGARAHSFCTGDTIRLAGPGTVTLPSCEVDVSGNWWGGYARRTADYEPNAISVSLNLRKEASSLRGELTTSDGTFDVVSISESNSRLELQATRATAGGQQKIVLYGNVSKGEIVFGGSERSPGGAKTYQLTGFLTRLYVADNSLPPAALNQPYSFRLVALSPTGNPVNFRLANPAPKQPDQITWDTEPQSLRGRNGERFTYLCPPNGSLGRLYSRDNAYTDSSSICTAAVSAHVITQQAGGVVTIEIRPGPSPDTGRFVFAAAERATGVSGRLPQGMSFDAKSGTFSGTPAELGSFEISIVADDGAGNTFEQPLTVSVKKMIVTNGWLADAFVGQPYKATLQVRGGSPPYRFTGNAPKGLLLDPNTGELNGTPTLSASGFDVTVRDSQNNSETVRVSLRVRGTTILTSYFLPEATQGAPYRAQFRAVGNSSSINWSVDRDQLSWAGFTLDPQTGELSGTPTKAGEFSFSVRAQASDGHTRSFVLVVNPSAARPERPN